MDSSSILMQQELIESTLWNKNSSIVFCNTFIVNLLRATIILALFKAVTPCF